MFSRVDELFFRNLNLLLICAQNFILLRLHSKLKYYFNKYISFRNDKDAQCIFYSVPKIDQVRTSSTSQVATNPIALD